MTLLWLLALCGAGFYLLSAQRHRELALTAVRQHCKRMDVQLLDQTVALKRLWIKRHKNGKPALWRRYDFEFTGTGEDRNIGWIITLGNQIESVEFEPHRFY